MRIAIEQSTGIKELIDDFIKMNRILYEALAFYARSESYESYETITTEEGSSYLKKRRPAVILDAGASAQHAMHTACDSKAWRRVYLSQDQVDPSE